ncbi:MAG: glycoside hydrolase [Actinobacteria bacterium]|nr:MAG: glycoside hydrolase [Actinomycetota bacterium]
MPRIHRTLLVIATVALFPGCGHAAQPARPIPKAPSPAEADQLAAQSATAFLDGYVDPGGRVVRRDQGGDTVGEGQAYGMLVAAALGDSARFDRIWGWTQSNLQRPDGLLAFHWVNGAVRDHQAASDADLDAARALLVAGCRFNRADLRAAAGRIGRAVLAHETSGRVLTAGPWAAGGGRTVFNPSYLDPSTLIGLGHLTGDHRYSAVAERGRSIIRGVSRPLPPDWATVAGGAARAVTSARGFRGSGRFSWDAPRALVRLAADPDPAGRKIAARAWPVFRNRLPGDIVVEHHLDGRRAGSSRSSVTLVAAAAAAEANGYRDNAALLLHDAAALQQQRPTYYGAAWTALGRLLLTTQRLDVKPC